MPICIFKSSYLTMLLEWFQSKKPYTTTDLMAVPICWHMLKLCYNAQSTFSGVCVV